MPLTKDERDGVIKQYGKNEQDTGSTSVQIALLTKRINQLTGHFQTNPKDHLSRRGLLKMVGKRRKLLDYLASQELEAYRALIQKLGIRR